MSCLWAGGGPRARTRCGRASPLLRLRLRPAGERVLVPTSPLLRRRLRPTGERVLVPRVRSEWILFPLSGCFPSPQPRDPCPGAGAIEAHVGSSVPSATGAGPSCLHALAVGLLGWRPGGKLRFPSQPLPAPSLHHPGSAVEP